MPRNSASPAPDRAQRRRTPACPRCAYDQSGAIAAWTTRCPTSATCPECGLDFAWRDVLSPAFGRLPWLYEHSRALGIRSLVASLRRAAIPSRFWRRVKMSHTISPRRLIMLVLLTVIGLHLLAGASRVLASIWLVQQTTRFYFTDPSGARIARAPTFLEASRAMTRQWRPVLAQAALPIGSLRRHYQPNATMVQALSVPSRAVFLLHLWWAFMLIVLPDTRRIAKVRPAHIARALAYPLALVLALLYLGAAASHWLDAWSVIHWRSNGRLRAIADASALILGIAWAIWWWHDACRVYLRLPRPLLVFFVTGGVSLFGTLVVALACVVFVLAPARDA